MFALPVLTARASYRHAVASVRWTLAGIGQFFQNEKNLSTYIERLSFVFALPIFTARASYRHTVASVLWTLAGIGLFFLDKKNLSTYIERLSFVFALPIFTASHPATIVGVHVLNFCVRDGNRWTHMTINTNSFG